MHRLHRTMASIAVLTVLTGCGGDLDTTSEQIETTMTTTYDIDAALRQRAARNNTIRAERAWYAELARQMTERAEQDAAAEELARWTPPQVAATGPEGGLGPTAGDDTTPGPTPDGQFPCGGTDYPPCYVAQNESGNNYYRPDGSMVVNWGGCGGRNCYGRWQFSGEWACKLGLPCDLLTATPEQQDAAARALWRGGAGCSNWAAC